METKSVAMGGKPPFAVAARPELTCAKADVERGSARRLDTKVVKWKSCLLV
jgi:hypothetical protein